MADTLGDHDATGLASLVRAGDVTPVELVEAAINRIETVDPQLNAVIHRRFDRARDEAARMVPGSAPFAGVPFLVKDIACHQAGEPFHEGMRFLRDRHWRAASDSHLAARFRAAGLITVGRTNAPELGIVPTTEPDAYGATRNPWDRARSPGGSSGGSAAAVAAGLVPAAHANDGGGSIRIPASACGVVGLKPSRGRTSLGPDASFTALVVCEHVVCRTVRDCAAFLDAVAGPMPGDPYVAPPPVRPYRQEVGADPGRLRVGLLTAAPGGLAVVAPECVTAAEDAARLLESLGHEVEVSHPAALDRPDWAPHFMSLWSAGVALGLDGRRAADRRAAGGRLRRRTSAAARRRPARGDVPLDQPLPADQRRRLIPAPRALRGPRGRRAGTRRRGWSAAASGGWGRPPACDAVGWRRRAGSASRRRGRGPTPSPAPSGG